MSSQQDEWDKELFDCPDCGSDVVTGDMEYSFENMVLIEVYCRNHDCNFNATEEYTIDKTVREEASIAPNL